MANNQRKSQTYRNYKPNNQFIYLLPAFIALTIVPLLVRLKALRIPKENLVWKTADYTDVADLFAYYKGHFLIIAAVIGLLIMFFTYKRAWTFDHSPYIYFLYAYICIITISALVSINPSLSLTGYYERYEGYFVLLAYIILFFYTSTHIKEEKQFHTLIMTWSVTALIMFIIGVSQFFNYDFITSELGKWLTIPLKYRELGVSANQDTDNIRNVYETLYHYNYVSFYAAIGFPFFISLALSEKILSKKMFYYFISLAFTISQIMSLSRNGYIGIIGGLIIVLLFNRKRIFKYWKILLPGAIVLVVATSVFIMMSDSVSAVRIRQGLTSFAKEDTKKLEYIRSDNGSLNIKHKDFELSITEETTGDELDFLYSDLQGNPYTISFNKDLNRFVFDRISPDILTLEYGTYNDQITILLHFGDKNWYFSYYDNNYQFVGPDQRLVPLESAPHIGFDGRETFASSRGYIWSRSLPVIFDHWLFGSGPDTFALVFPQDDFIGKYNAYDTPYIIVDKPHNIYLNYASNTGLLSLVVLLLLWGYYIIDCFRLYYKNDAPNYYSRIGIASLAAVVGYLISGIFNDTTVNVTPAFWIILGLGFSANAIVKRNSMLNK